jgi:hypothetical protein
MIVVMSSSGGVYELEWNIPNPLSPDLPKDYSKGMPSPKSGRLPDALGIFTFDRYYGNGLFQTLSKSERRIILQPNLFSEMTVAIITPFEYRPEMFNIKFTVSGPCRTPPRPKTGMWSENGGKNPNSMKNMCAMCLSVPKMLLVPAEALLRAVGQSQFICICRQKAHTQL